MKIDSSNDVGAVRPNEGMRDGQVRGGQVRGWQVRGGQVRVGR